MQPLTATFQWRVVLAILSILVVCLPGAFVHGAPQISVAWGLGGTPSDPENYHVDYSDPGSPTVQLFTGDTYWFVWSRDDVTGAVSDIGTIEAYGEANYTLLLLDPSLDPGARNVQSIILDPTSHQAGVTHNCVM